MPRLGISHCILQVIAFASLVQWNVVLASVYPTHPVAKTVFFCGKPEVILWRDDWREPYLEDMPHMNIELYNNTDYVATLAKHVRPTDQSHTVSIPTKLETGSNYALVFKTTNPPMSFWSADFSIMSESQNYLFPARPAVANTTKSSPSPSFTSSSSTINPETASTPHPNPVGAHPGSPFRDGGEGSKRNAAMNLGPKMMQPRASAVLVTTLVFATMAL